MPSLKEAVVTQPRPEIHMRRHAVSAWVLALGAMPAALPKPSGTPERSLTMAETSRPSARDGSKEMPPSSDLLSLAS